MKGIIFNLLESSTQDAHGEDGWDDMLDATGSDGVYTSLGNYSDSDLLALLQARAERDGLDPAEALRDFGRQSISLLAARHPEFFESCADLRELILSIDDVIHREVRKIYPGAQPPRFETEEPDDQTVVLLYTSQRRLCDYAKGMIEGAATYFEEGISLSETECSRDGADACRIVVSFERDG